MQPLTRTMATLEYRTDLICKFAVKGMPQEFSLAALKKKLLRKHFILFFTQEANGKKIYEDIKIISEISLRSNKLHFNIKVSQTYPEFAEFEKVIEETVNEILTARFSELATA